MKMNGSTKGTIWKIMVPVVVIWGIITIFKGGVAFGSWLHAFIN